MKVSERSVRRAKNIGHRQDLVQAVAAGTMSLHQAWLEATGKRPQSGLDRLRAAYRAATLDEKAAFVAEIMDIVDRSA